MSTTEDTGATAEHVALQQVAEKILGPVKWETPTKGICRCPGAHLHTTQTTNKCTVFLDGVPTVTCFHAHCAGVIGDANRELRRSASAVTGGRKLSPAEAREKRQQREERLALERQAAESFSRVLEQYRWPVARIMADSPFPVPDDQVEQTRMALSLFEEQDIVWVGSQYDSGKPEHAGHFRPAAEWWTMGWGPYYPHISTCTFKPGVYGRTKENMVARRFLAVESDTLGFDDVGAVFRWLRDAVGLRLFAVVFTGNKSLHGWFELPGEKVEQELRMILPLYQCDPKMFTPTQITRMPGAVRSDTGLTQQMLHFAGRIA